MAHIITCRICKKKFDIDAEDYVLVGQKAYYHKACYDEWRGTKDHVTANNTDENFWYEAMVDYLYRDVKMGDMDFSKIRRQWGNFVKPSRGFTPKGVYFAIRYFYDVLHGDVQKAQGGIGIVSSIYNDSAEYWVKMENKKEGTLEAIIQQIRERNARPVIVVTRKKEKKNKARWSLDDI